MYKCQKQSDLNNEVTLLNQQFSLSAFIDCIRIAVPAIFKIMLVPSEVAHKTVGIDTVSDNIKKVIPTTTNTRPINILFKLFTSLTII
jgi:hypothetical protein